MNYEYRYLYYAGTCQNMVEIIEFLFVCSRVRSILFCQIQMRSYVKTVHQYLIQANKKISIPVRRETTNFLWTFLQHKYFQVCWNALLAVVNAELLGRRWQLFFILKIVAEKQFSNKWFDSFRYRTGTLYIHAETGERDENWSRPEGGGSHHPLQRFVPWLSIFIIWDQPSADTFYGLR